MHHDLLRDALVDFCHNAHLGVKVEIGSRLTPDLRQSHPANLLVAVCVPLAVETCGNWGREAAHTTFTRLVLGLKSVLLCRKVGSLLTFVGDLVLC